MKKLDRLGLKHAPAWQQALLAAWLREWNAAQALDSLDIQNASRALPGDSAETETLEEHVAPFEENIEVGQVRLLSPSVGLPAEQRPLAVAVLRQADAHTFLAAPFSRFSLPALPGELSLEGLAPGLSVLCPWNAGHFDATVLAQSWVMTTLTEEQLSDCTAVYEHIASDAVLPVHLLSRVGPALIHIHDPRLTYRDEERLMMKLLTGNTTAERNGLIYSPHARDRLPLAAEERTTYNDDSPTPH